MSSLINYIKLIQSLKNQNFHAINQESYKQPDEFNTLIKHAKKNQVLNV